MDVRGGPAVSRLSGALERLSASRAQGAATAFEAQPTRMTLAALLTARKAAEARSPGQRGAGRQLLPGEDNVPHGAPAVASAGDSRSYDAGIRAALLGGARTPVTPIQAVLEASVEAQVSGRAQSRWRSRRRSLLPSTRELIDWRDHMSDWAVHPGAYEIRVSPTTPAPRSIVRQIRGRGFPIAFREEKSMAKWHPMVGELVGLFDANGWGCGFSRVVTHAWRCRQCLSKPQRERLHGCRRCASRRRLPGPPSAEAAPQVRCGECTPGGGCVGRAGGTLQPRGVPSGMLRRGPAEGASGAESSGRFFPGNRWWLAPGALGGSARGLRRRHYLIPARWDAYS